MTLHMDGYNSCAYTHLFQSNSESVAVLNQIQLLLAQPRHLFHSVQQTILKYTTHKYKSTQIEIELII